MQRNRCPSFQVSVFSSSKTKIPSEKNGWKDGGKKGRREERVIGPSTGRRDETAIKGHWAINVQDERRMGIPPAETLM
jgi:hypothetical protein